MTDDRTRAHAGALWAFRAGAELDAAARFDRIATALARHDAHRGVVDLARQAAADEVRHHDRCAALARRFGTTPPPKRMRVAPPLRVAASDDRCQTLYEAIAMGCVTESLSVALLLEMKHAAQDDEVDDTIAEILRDEVQHSRLGWAHLAAEHERINLDFVTRQLPGMLADTLHEEVFATPDPHEDESLAGLGGLPRRRRVAVVIAALREVVFPGLARFGIDTTSAEAWLAKRLTPRNAA
jgi:hypothetical protein